MTVLHTIFILGGGRPIRGGGVWGVAMAGGGGWPFCWWLTGDYFQIREHQMGAILINLMKEVLIMQ